MINFLHACFHRPENGWDPITVQHSENYGSCEWKQGANEALMDELDRWVGGLKGKRVLDLGGGPGQYTIAFAKKGADVTWHDVSRTYRNMVKQKAQDHGVHVHFSLGYLDEAHRLLFEPFDLVFNRLCWYYCFSDYSFADVVFKLVKPGGVGYIDTNTSGYQRDQLSSSARFRSWLNDTYSIKVGHPYPPHGRLAMLFARKSVEKFHEDYSSPFNDRLFFVKNRNSDQGGAG